MIIGGDKTKVVENIKDLAEKRQLNSKVEVDDPNMSEQEEQQLLTDFIAERATLSYHSKNMIARQGMALATDILNRQTIVTGAQNIMGIIGGAIVTSNHFNPLENTAIRYALKKVNNKRIFVISQPTNFKMTGWVGFFLKYADTLPISRSIHYMGRTFPTLLQNIFVKNNYVLIYPEKEMWFNYRKPRPFKRGPYYYAARFNVPIISCFVEMVPQEENDNDQFKQINYKVHILKPIYPEQNKNNDENSLAMMQQDYLQKKEAYETAYHTKLTYDFEDGDVVGWNGPKI